MGLNQEQRQRIFRRDNFTCQYCGLDASTEFEKWYYANLNVDHINPDAGDNDENLITACRTCNSIKGAIRCKTLDEAKAIVAIKIRESEEWFEKNVLPHSQNKRQNAS